MITDLLASVRAITDIPSEEEADTGDSAVRPVGRKKLEFEK